MGRALRACAHGSQEAVMGNRGSPRALAWKPEVWLSREVDGVHVEWRGTGRHRLCQTQHKRLEHLGGKKACAVRADLIKGGEMGKGKDLLWLHCSRKSRSCVSRYGFESQFCTVFN